MVKKSLYLLFFTVVCCVQAEQIRHDLTLIGEIDFTLGVGRTAYYLIDSLGDDLKIGYYDSSSFSANEQDPYQIKRKFFTTSTLTDSSMYLDTRRVIEMSMDPMCQDISPEKIRLAYSVWEATLLPQDIIEQFNTDFDAIIVADPFLVEVYKKSGVTTPLFCIPHILYLEKFLQEPIKKRSNKPFVFGSVATIYKRKNLKKLIIAFDALYKNNPDFLLKLHCKDLDKNAEGSLFGLEYTGKEETIPQLIERLDLHNIVISSEVMTEQQYLTFFKTIDCYALLSKGEGFSITPREALALGIPCILSDNTAHTTICKSGCVLPVACPDAVNIWLQETEVTSQNSSELEGNQFDCRTEDVMAAMQEMVTHYDVYLAKAHCGREWVKQYLASALKDEYLTMFAPKNVILSDENKLDKATGTIYTNSVNLYNKMKKRVEEAHVQQ